MKLGNFRRQLSIVMVLCFLISCMSSMGSFVTLQAQETYNVFYDFRTGTIVPADTDGKSDLTYDDLTIKAGTKNAYAYHGTTHGIVLKAGNSIELTVPGSVTVTIGDCQYSSAKSMTLTDANGAYSQTEASGIANYHNGGIVEFQYEGEATVLTLNIEGTTYIPCISVTNAKNEVETPETPETPDEEEEDILANPDTSIQTWYFDGVHETSYKGNLQKKADFINNLYVDATNGKFTARITENGYSSDQGDTQVGQGTKVYIPVDSKATVYVITNSVADMSVGGTMLKRTGTVATTEALSHLETTGNVYTYENSSRKKGYVCLTFESAGYLKGLHVAYADFEVPSVSSALDVWDFSGTVESTEEVNSYITAETYSAVDGKTFTTIESKGVTYPVFSDGNGGESNTVGSLSFGDLTLNYRYKDRLYTTQSEYSYSNKLNSYTTLTYPDGYVAAGGYFANGTSSAKHRNIEIKNVEAGDVITVYMTSSREANADYPNPADTLHFQYTGSDGTQDETGILSNAAGMYVFTAQYSGTYKIYADATNGTKPVISRVTRKHTSGVITGTLDFSLVEDFDDADYGLVLVSEDGTRYEAVLSNDGAAYYVVTPNDGAYTAILTNAKGYEISAETCTLTGGNKTHDFMITAVDLFQVTGSVSGFDADFHAEGLKLYLQALNERESITIDVTDMTFDGRIESGVSYIVTLLGANDYVVAGETAITVTEDTVFDVTVEKAPVYEVTGHFTNIMDVTSVSNLVFTNLEDNYAYQATITETGYMVNLRDGMYQASAKVSGYTMNTTVTVNSGAVVRDLLFIPNALEKGSVEWASDIYVGYTDKVYAHSYETINQALAIAYAMNPKSEDQRITIHVAPGTYREQVMVEVPYISLVNDTDQEVLVTWYYGIGYEYYSANENGFYDESAAYNKTSKNIATKWGCSVYVKSSAKAFRASGIVFENSFNRYITEEELEDGVQLSSRADSSITVERTKELDVKSREATERAAAMVIEADQTEFYNCQFLSSQDTLYTGPNITGYFLDCKIEGGVDYIFGYGDYVFDSCKLSFYGYSNKNAAGYITACRTPKTEGLGYLFNNCIVTGNEDAIVAPGYFGRPWGADATVTFLNTTLANANLIQPAGWYSMSGVQPEAANYSEYGTKLEDGTSVDTSGRISGTVLTSQEAEIICVTDYFGDWTPVFYGYEGK